MTGGRGDKAWQIRCPRVQLVGVRFLTVVFGRSKRRQAQGKLGAPESGDEAFAPTIVHIKMPVNWFVSIPPGSRGVLLPR